MLALALPSQTCFVIRQGAKKIMWSWITCYVSGHDYAVSCQGGAMFLRCVLCGRRSQGWLVHRDEEHTH